MSKIRPALTVKVSTGVDRLRIGTVIRFAGRHWRVRSASSSGIEVEPSREPAALQLSYSGGNAPLDASIVEAVLRILEDPERKLVTGDPAIRARIESLGAVLSRRVIPMVRHEGRHLYFTFAGRLINGIIGLWSGTPGFEAGEITLAADSQVDFAALPDSRALTAHARATTAVPENLTLFQQLLPPELLDEEVIDAWEKTPAYSRILGRLRVTPIELVPATSARDLLALL